MSVTFSRLGVPLALRRRSFTSLTTLSELGGGGGEGGDSKGKEKGVENREREREREK